MIETSIKIRRAMFTPPLPGNINPENLVVFRRYEGEPGAMINGLHVTEKEYQQIIDALNISQVKHLTIKHTTYDQN
jgi:hypothetical protein